MSEENVENGADEQAATETRARDMGWQPQENWKGAPEKWVDAAEFVKRGETFVPFLQHTRKRLEGELAQERQARAMLEKRLAETESSVADVRKFSEEMAAERRERRKAEIAVELKAAREAGEDVRVAELQNELGEVVKPPAPPPPERRPAPTQPEVLPWVKSYVDADADFFKDPVKVAVFNTLAVQKRQAGDTRTGEVDGVAFLNEVKEAANAKLGGNPARRQPSKTEDSRPAGRENGGRSAGQSYGDMDQAARDKCDAQEAKFVGPSKAFKTQAEWRKFFASEHFGPSAAATAMRGN